VKGRGAVREWVKLRERNEALDLEVYALAALYVLGQLLIRSLKERAARFARTVANSEAPVVLAARQARWPAMRGRRGGWVNSWRGR